MGRKFSKVFEASFVLLFLFVGFAFVSETTAQSTREITISAAISLKAAFEDIGKTFMERHPGAKVLFNFAGSGALARQIEAGAPVDVFASAGQKDMNDLDQRGMIIKETRKDFVRNSLALITPAKSAIQLTSLGDLRRGEIQKIAIGNPKTVPAGSYAEEALRYFKLWDGLRDKLIFTENVRQVLDYVVRGEVDAGMVYSTDVLARAKDVKIVLEAPIESHQPVIYPIAVVKGSKKETLAKDFIDAVTSREGEKIFERYGFGLLRQRK